MNKKGFTVIEIIISISLVSIILIPLLVTLVKLRDTYANVNDDTDARVIGSSIARTINNDIKDNCGIKSIECSNERECILSLSNDQKRQLTLKINEETEDIELELQSQQNTEAKKITTRTTLEYKDITDENNHKKLLTKTLTSILERITTKRENQQQNKVEEVLKYNHITGFTLNTNSYTTPQLEKKSQTLYILTINISDPKYNIKIYGIN